MLINKANIDALFKDYTNAFQGGMENAPALDIIKALSTEFPSNSTSNFYTFLDKSPGFREWFGPRRFEDLVVRDFEVANRTWEESYRLSREDYEDDQLNFGAIQMQQAGQNYRELQLELLMYVLIDNPTCWTGDNLFGDTHALYGATTLDNRVTDALSATTFDAAFATAADWKFRNGKPCRTRWTHLLVGPKLRNTAWNIVENSLVATTESSIDNPNKGRTQLVVSELLNATSGAAANVDSADYWYLLDLSRGVKPLGMQVRRAAAVMMDLDPTNLERTNQVDIMASARIAALPTFPHLCYVGQAT